ncbi:hypothetical protein [Haliangium ochraceum]|uniref:hypothetical protein n=1 Tax=Haliangium ochraceum TaxID=80816 RepID=UPI001E444138|nr:hypothetical protein [Haliangium ochraceum]
MHRAFCGTEPPDAATPSAASPVHTAPSPPLPQAAGPSHPPAAPVQRKPAQARETPLTRARRTRAIDDISYERFSSKGGTIWHVARFKPDAPPSFAHDNEAVPAAQRAKDVRSWDEVKAHHERLQAVIAQLASASPVLYQAAAQGDDNALATMAAAPPGEARGTMAQRLSDQLSNIRTTQAELGSDLDELECTPLHEQLFAGAASASGTAWNAPAFSRPARAWPRAEHWLPRAGSTPRISAPPRTRTPARAAWCRARRPIARRPRPSSTARCCSSI